jgi:hypothetical protein
MSLHVIGAKINGFTGNITVESDEDNFGKAIEELQSPDARKLAMSEAAKQGLGQSSVNGLATPAYPVDEKGNLIEKLTPGEKPYRYRCDIPVISRSL